MSNKRDMGKDAWAKVHKRSEMIREALSLTHPVRHFYSLTFIAQLHTLLVGAADVSFELKFFSFDLPQNKLGCINTVEG
jgi:hypothetical protein